MKFPVDPFVFRLVLALIAVPATALAILQLPRLQAGVEERRVQAYIHRMQPQLAADPRFRYVEFQGTRVYGCVSNSDVFKSLKEIIEGAKPPRPISLGMVRTNESDWRLRDDARKGEELLKKADVILDAGSDRAQFTRPRGTNFVKTPAEFEATLSSVQHRGLAVITFYAYGYDQVTNEVAQSAAILKQCGFREVRPVVLQYGKALPYYAQ